MLRLLCAGLHKDRYVQELLNHFLKNRFRDIGEGKIPLGGKSWYLMGAPDPTGQLEEGQCFLAIKGRPQDTHGKVLVYHSPGLHFGDARVLEAVYPRGIEEYIGDGVNAIFFSTKGKRLVTDMMAGGDLDGDMFLVCKHTQVREQLEARVMKKQGSDWSRFTMPQILASFSQSPPYEAGPQPPHPASSPSSTLLCPAVLENDEICRSRCDMALNTLFNKRYGTANRYLLPHSAMQAPTVFSFCFCGGVAVMRCQRLQMLTSIWSTAVSTRPLLACHLSQAWNGVGSGRKQ